jgi:hypothetical protein
MRAPSMMLGSETHSSTEWAPSPSGPKITVGMPAAPRSAESNYSPAPATTLGWATVLGRGLLLLLLPMARPYQKPSTSTRI